MIFVLALLPLHILAIYQIFIYPLFLSPLRHVPPAHWSCRFSTLWILWRRWRFRENASILAAHQRHGSVVMLGPSELSVNCVDDGIRTIYNGNFEKHDIYPNLFTNYGVHVMFSTTESSPHSLRKRMLSGIYSSSSIRSSETFATAEDKIIRDRMISRITDHGTAPLDAKRLFESATMDVVTAYLFGAENGSNFLETPDEASKWLELYQSRRHYTFWPQELPGVLALLKVLGIHLVPKWVSEANDYLENWCMDLCKSAEQRFTNEKTSNLDRQQTVYQHLRSQLSKEPRIDRISQRDPSIPQATYLAAEMLDHIGAGHETSAITLTFLFHELSLRPSLQDSLRAELAATPEHQRTQNKPTPLLDAAIHETLRLHAAIPGPQPRLTPHTSASTTLGPHAGIPGGIRVSASAWSLHRAPAVFAEPETWRPERWLDAPDGSASAIATQHRWFWAFGSGARMCIGRHLALAQLRAIAAAVLARFEVVRADGELVEGSVDGADGDDGEDMAAGSGRMREPLRLARPFAQEDAYTAQPVARELMLRFKAVGAAAD